MTSTYMNNVPVDQEEARESALIAMQKLPVHMYDMWQSGSEQQLLKLWKRIQMWKSMSYSSVIRYRGENHELAMKYRREVAKFEYMAQLVEMEMLEEI